MSAKISEAEWNQQLDRQHQELQNQRKADGETVVEILEYSSVLDLLMREAAEELNWTMKTRLFFSSPPNRLTYGKGYQVHYVGNESLENQDTELTPKKDRRTPRFRQVIFDDIDENVDLTVSEEKHNELRAEYSLLCMALVDACRELGLDITDAETPGALLTKLTDYAKSLKPKE